MFKDPLSLIQSVHEKSHHVQDSLFFNDYTTSQACLGLITGEELMAITRRFGDDRAMTWQEEATLLVEHKLFPIYLGTHEHIRFEANGVYLISIPDLDHPGLIRRLVVTVLESSCQVFDPHHLRNTTSRFVNEPTRKIATDALFYGGREELIFNVTYIDPRVLDGMMDFGLDENIVMSSGHGREKDRELIDLDIRDLRGED